MNYIRELCAEAHEILNNIRQCPELTYQQRNELIKLVETDRDDKIKLAIGLLQAWRRDDMTSETRAG